MSYAIIRNEKYTKEQMNQLSPHNERFKKKYSNKNIDLSKTSQNYHLKKPIENTYYKEYKRLVKQNNLYQGQIHSNSIYACEMILTSDVSFFNKIGEKETKRYFQECYNFIANYQGLGKENILTAVIHMDEESPHMHLVYIPVVKVKGKDGNDIKKISAREFWKGKTSYKKLQDEFYKYIIAKGFNLERGKENSEREHIKTDDMKAMTNFYNTKALKLNLNESKDSMINYQDVQDFYKFEAFTKENVDKKLIYPLLKYNQKLTKENKDLIIELSKAKNVTEYFSTLEEQYVDLQEKNKELENQLNCNKIELDACYEIIKNELAKNEKLNLNKKYEIKVILNDKKDKNVGLV